MRGYKKVCEFPHSDFLHNLEDMLSGELNAILEQEETHWIMKSRCDWIVKGDRNTKFFHKSVVIKRKQRKIVCLNDDVGNEINEPAEIGKHIIEFFAKLFCTEQVVCVGGQKETNLIPRTGITLSGRPKPGEVRNALFHMGALKSPGSDGLHAIFFQRYWETTKDDLIQFIQGVFDTGVFPKELNKLVICLIPKVDNSLNVKQFRPISLCNTVYKLITKILVNRLRPHLEDMIFLHQNAFVAGRGSDINFVVANEIMHSMKGKKGKMGWFALKIDLEKTYDRLEWSFIKNCLTYHKLDNKTIDLIMHCITTTSGSVLVNGALTKWFSPSRGIRQGDPLSPYIFILFMDMLSRLIHEAWDGGEWRAFGIGKRKTPITHLFFADGLIVFGECERETLESVQNTLNKL